MRITRIKKQTYCNYIIATLVFVDTEIPVTVDIQEVIDQLDEMVSNMGSAVMPRENEPSAALVAFQAAHLDDSKASYLSSYEKDAHFWLRTHAERPIAVEIDDIFATNKTWFVSLWCIFPQTMLTRPERQQHR